MYKFDRNFNGQKQSFEFRNNNYNSKYLGGRDFQGANISTFKKSGAVYSKIRKGKMEGLTCCNAWRKTKLGLMTASIMPYSDELIEGSRDNQYIKMLAEVTNRSLGTTQKYTCLMNIKTQVITIKELGLVITPNGQGRTSSGKIVRGYFGKFTK